MNTSYSVCAARLLRSIVLKVVPEYGKDTPLPRLKDLHAEYATILERKKKTYADYRKQKSEMQDYLMAQKIVEVMLEKDDREKEQLQLQQEQNRKQR